MAANSSDFVLDDGLDDDEDVLAYHSSRQQQQQMTDLEESTESNSQQSSTPINPESSTIGDKNKSDNIKDSISTSTSPIHAVIIDGLPLGSSRSDLNEFLPATAVSHVTSVRLRRLEEHGLLRVRIEFNDETPTKETLQLDGTQFHAPEGPHLSVKRATPERWDASSGLVTSVKKQIPLSGPSAIDSVRTSLWGAVGFAKVFAERLEDSARKIGEQLEDRLHVSEKVSQTKNTVERLDKEYKVQERFGEAVENGKRTAEDIDKTYGISDGVGKIQENVGNAARIVAREVDENLRVSDKARGVANAALKNETLAPVARTVVGGIGEETASNKNYQPVTETLNGQNEQDGEGAAVTGK